LRFLIVDRDHQAGKHKNNIYISLPVYTPLMKPMHGAILIVTVVSLIVIGGLGALYLSSPSEQPPAAAVNNTSAIHVGFVQMNANVPESYFTLDDAVAAVNGIQNEINGSSQNPQVYYVMGQKVNAAGQAQHWILGIRQGSNTTLKTYDRTGVATIPWQWDKLPDQAIDISGILSPAEIMNLTNSGNQTGAGDAQIEISRGVYTVTMPSGSQPREYLINATTGVVIATHD